MLNITLKFIAISVIYVLGYGTSELRGQSKVPLFEQYYRNDFNARSIRIKVKQRYFIDTEIRLITLFSEGKPCVAYYEIPRKKIDSSFLKTHKHFLYIQSCGGLQSDGLNFIDFECGDYVYLEKACTRCYVFKMLPDNYYCHRFKVKFNAFLKKYGISVWEAVSNDS